MVALTLWPGSAGAEDGGSGDGDSTPSFLMQIRAPAGLTPPETGSPVVVAVVDDALDVDDPELREFLWTNDKEVPDNRIDDDGNGKVDDVCGWDVADDDGDVRQAEGREAEMKHGTNLARIISRTARHAYGKEAPNRIRILPVKTLEDGFTQPYLKSGYKGIRYAADLGADIILTAWGEVESSSRDLRILEAASARGSLIVAAAGNHYGERRQYPAAQESALAVAAVDSNWARLRQSSYGEFVDLVAPGTGGVEAEWKPVEGSSMAAAVVAGAIAVLKSQNPMETRLETLVRLLNTALPVEAWQGGELFMSGKLGAGFPNLAAALQYPIGDQPPSSNNLLEKHQGYLVRNRPAPGLVLWKIRPSGEFSGIWLKPKRLAGSSGESRLQVFKESPGEGRPILDVALSDWREPLFIPSVQAFVLLNTDAASADYEWIAEFRTMPIDQSTLYCSGTRNITDEGILEDGSGEADYSPQSDCKWLITAPEGKVIQVEFLEFDTEPNTDWVYFFNGAGTHERIMAVFSGPEIPPELTSWTNQMLVWFVTNDRDQGRGWKASIRFVDPPVTSGSRN
mgnify:FL=1